MLCLFAESFDSFLDVSVVHVVHVTKHWYDKTLEEIGFGNILHIKMQIYV